MIASSAVEKVIGAVFLNLPGWCWARIKQLALIGSSSSLHSEACKALGGSDGVVHSTISLAAICMRAVAKDGSCDALARGKSRRVVCRKEMLFRIIPLTNVMTQEKPKRVSLHS